MMNMIEEHNDTVEKYITLTVEQQNWLLGEELSARSFRLGVLYLFCKNSYQASK